MEQERWSLFKCQRCGQCCEQLGLPWDGHDIEKMAKFLEMNPEDLTIKYYGEPFIENDRRFDQRDQDLRTPSLF